MDQALYSRMYPLDQAALLVHEALYRNLRRHHGYETSALARRYTALAFSNEEIKISKFPSSNYALCVSKVENSPRTAYKFFVIKNADGSYTLRQTRFNELAPIEPFEYTPKNKWHMEALEGIFEGKLPDGDRTIPHIQKTRYGTVQLYLEVRIGDPRDGKIEVTQSISGIYGKKADIKLSCTRH